MGNMMHREHGPQMAMPFVPMPMACFGMAVAFMLGMMLGMKKAGGMRAGHGYWDGRCYGEGYGYGRGKKMGMHHHGHHHHHGFGAPECECGSPEPRERPEGAGES